MTSLRCLIHEAVSLKSSTAKDQRLKRHVRVFVRKITSSGSLLRTLDAGINIYPPQTSLHPPILRPSYPQADTTSRRSSLLCRTGDAEISVYAELLVL